ncbi:MAG: metallopeptidase family protein [Patescibacteria group bacterium]
MLLRREFEQMVADAYDALPEHFRTRVKNVALLVEDEPSIDVRHERELGDHETLLGLYQGIPATERGDTYGIGMVLPDTITLYQKPIEEASEGDASRIREIVYDTMWHEIAHYFGMNEDEVRKREEEKGVTL